MSLQAPSALLGVSEHEKMFRSMRCAVEPRSAIYISGPITTGRIFVEWYESHGRKFYDKPEEYRQGLRANVILRNERNILNLAKSTRSISPGVVIEPASLVVEEWGQDDYIKFWLGILERFVSEVILVDGWEYSAGCVAEFNYSLRVGHVIRAQSGEIMSSDLAVVLVARAIDEIEDIALGDRRLLALSNSLRASMEMGKK